MVVQRVRRPTLAEMDLPLADALRLTAEIKRIMLETA